MNNFLQGKKTYIGIGIFAISFFGLNDFITPDQVESLVTAILAIAGIVYSIYGNYDAHDRLNEAEAENMLLKVGARPSKI